MADLARAVGIGPVDLLPKGGIVFLVQGEDAAANLERNEVVSVVNWFEELKRLLPAN